jgi:hypothetical protein
MKQTAVEWLFLMLNNPNKDQKFANKLLKQAKEMEKEQIIDAAYEFMGTNFDPNKGRAELYYKGTYGGDNGKN